MSKIFSELDKLKNGVASSGTINRSEPICSIDVITMSVEKTESLQIKITKAQMDYLDQEGLKKGGLNRQDIVRMMIAEKMEEKR
jgi:hypothetical protein